MNARSDTVPAPGGATRVFVLLGDPVGHSLSPGMHNAAFAAAGVDAVYVTLRARAEDVPALMRALARAGGGGNVTVPFKTVAAAALSAGTDAVRATGACNTFWWEDGALRGDNTDVAGFAAAALAVVPTLTGIRTLVLGAGGAARAAVHALLDRGVAELVVVNRSVARAVELVAAVAPDDRRVRVSGRTAEVGGDFDLVVNATSLGLRPEDTLPLAPDPRRHGAVLDLVYRPGGTAFTRAAAAAGIPAAEGTEMLLRQGAAAWERWMGRPAPLAAMRAALEAAPAPGDGH